MFECGPLGKGRSQPGEHATAGREDDKGLTALRESLMIACQPTPAGDPGEAALHHPSPGKRTEAGGEELVPLDLLCLGHQDAALGHAERANRLHDPAHLLFKPGDERASVMAIAPQQLDGGEGLFEGLNQRTRACLIGALGPQHFDRQQVALRVNQQVPFASPDFFSPCRSPFQGRARHWF